MTGLEHVQLALPAGQEATTVVFYQALLGLPHVCKPANLAGRAACSFERGPVRPPYGLRRASARHASLDPILLVEDFDELAARLRGAGVPVSVDEPLEGFERVYVADPFGHRVELLHAHEPAPSA